MAESSEPAPTLSAVPLAKLTAALLSVAMVAVAPFKFATPPLAVVMFAAPATLIVPLDNVGIVAPAAKLVIPAPVSVPIVAVPPVFEKFILPELASAPHVKLLPATFIAAPLAIVA